MTHEPDGFWHDNGVAVYDYPPQDRPKYQLLGWMSEEDFRSLKLSIAISGKMLTPTVLDENGDILDGHHRDLAYQQLTEEGFKIVKPVPQIVTGLNEEEKRHFALRTNMVRRQITRQQRRQIIADEVRRSPDLANAWIAEVCGVDGKTVAEVRKELEARSEIPTITTFRRRDGKTCPAKVIVPRTAKQADDVCKHLKVIGSEVASTLPRIIKKQAEEKERDNRAADAPEKLTLTDIDIRNCWFQDLDLAHESVQLVCTDIPFDRVFADSGELAEFAAFAERILVPGGILVTYTGHLVLDRVIAELGKKLTYGWAMASYWCSEVSVVHVRNVKSQWLPLLIYFKKHWQKRKPWLDTLHVEGKEKDWHQDQRPLAEVKALVRYFSDPGDLVCDPFLGGGTTAVACHKLGRRFIGCEKLDNIYQRALARLQQEATPISCRNDDKKSGPTA